MRGDVAGKTPAIGRCIACTDDGDSPLRREFDAALHRQQRRGILDRDKRRRITWLVARDQLRAQLRDSIQLALGLGYGKNRQRLRPSAAPSDFREGFERGRGRTETGDELIERDRSDVLATGEPQPGEPLRGRQHGFIGHRSCRSRILVSSPRISRPILPTWRRTTSRAMTPTTAIGNVARGPNIHAQMGAKTAAASAASDEYRNTNATTSHVAIVARATGKLKARRTPAEVATPLPPLKPSHTGKRWPSTAAIAATAANSGPKPRATATATAPLPASRMSVAAANPLRPVRSTLVAPILPEPIRLTSPKPASVAQDRVSASGEGSMTDSACAQASRPKTVRPPTTVRVTLPWTGRPSYGAFLHLERNAATSMRHGRSRSKMARSAGAPGLRCPPGSRKISAGRCDRARTNWSRLKLPL